MSEIGQTLKTKGIRAKKRGGITIENKKETRGRQPTPISKDFIKYYEKYKVREVASKVELADMLNISRPTLDRLIAKYERL